jgi:ABC-2 type transport system permease protein
MFTVSTLTIVFMTLAVAGLAIGFGTLFPQFETENAAQIPTSFGGLLFMMSSIAVIAGVVILEARPVIGYLRARAFGEPTDPVAMAIGFGLAALLCITATVVPIRVALRRLEAIER